MVSGSQFLVYYFSVTVDGLLLVAYCLWFIVHCVQRIAYVLLLIPYRSSFSVHFSRCVDDDPCFLVYCLPCVVYSSSYVVYDLRFMVCAFQFGVYALCPMVYG